MLLEGDLLIGVDKRSVVTWMESRLFWMNSNGQNWGVPKSQWEAMTTSGEFKSIVLPSLSWCFVNVSMFVCIVQACWHAVPVAVQHVATARSLVLDLRGHNRQAWEVTCASESCK